MIKGELPQCANGISIRKCSSAALLHIDMQNFFRDYPQDSHPMSILAAMVASLSAFYPELADADPQANLDLTVARLLSRCGRCRIYHRQMNSAFRKPLL